MTQKDAENPQKWRKYTKSLIKFGSTKKLKDLKILKLTLKQKIN